MPNRILASRLNRALWSCVLALVVALVAPAAFAEDDLPVRVGRIAEVSGRLFLSPQDRASDWAEVGRNWPVTTGDNLWVAPDGEAEVDYGAGQLRLGGETNVHVSRLDDRQLALFLAQGRLILRVRYIEPGDVTYVDAPNTQVQLTRPGLYRIEVAPDRQTTVVTVREGEALVALASGAQQVLPGLTVTIAGADPVNADARNGIGFDAFDTWSSIRDRYYERSRAAAYVSRQMPGYADLDDYGTWQNTPEYGAVWFPTAVPVDWAPYSDGYWVNVGAWGFTWIDNAPWAYAPMHYGRWAHIGGRWGWCPGRIVQRPSWAPALVAWHGGPRWNLVGGDGAPVYGWVPLGWRDPYLPPWRGCSAKCWAGYNQPYGISVRERTPATYANMAVPGALTVVPRSVLVSAQPVTPNRVRVSGPQTAAAPLLGAAPPVSPGGARPPVAQPAPGTPPAVSAYVRNPGNRALEASIEARTPSAGAGTVPAAPRGSAAPLPARQTTMPVSPAVPSPARVEPRAVPQRVVVPPSAPAAPAYGTVNPPISPAPRVDRGMAPVLPPSMYAPAAPVVVPSASAPVLVQPMPVPQGPPAARAPAVPREAAQGVPQGTAGPATPAPLSLPGSPPTGVPAPLR